MKVVNLPENVGGNPFGISSHLNLLDVHSEVWVMNANYFGYSADKFICDNKDGFLARNLKKIISLRYIFKFDIVFFNFGSGIFDPYWFYDPQSIPLLKRPLYFIYSKYSAIMSRVELGLLRLLNKKIFIQYQGDDVRQGDVFGQFKINFIKNVEIGYYSTLSDDAKRKRVSFFCKRAAKVYALNPDLLHVLPSHAEFLPYSNININEWTPIYTQFSDRPLRIAHAPSHRGVKGTDLIISALDKLKQEGFKFEFILIEGMSNKDAKEIYKTVDIFVDQLYAGWYGGLAVEAMALGKPVICYIRDEDLRYLPDQMRFDLPFIRVEPDNIYDVLKSTISMARGELLDIAKQSRLYVERWHDPLKIAMRIKNDMEFSLGRTV